MPYPLDTDSLEAKAHFAIRTAASRLAFAEALRYSLPHDTARAVACEVTVFRELSEAMERAPAVASASIN